MVEAVDQVLKQGQGQKQGHAASLAELPCRRLLTAFGDGRLQHALDAVAAQAAVVADAFDLQPAPVDLPSQLLEVWQVGQTLIYVEIFGVAKVPSVRHPRPSWQYCFRSKFWYWMCSLGGTPLWITRVRNSPGVLFVTTRSKMSWTRSGRPRSRLSRMISSNNSRPRKGRSKIGVRLTSICQ